MMTVILSSSKEAAPFCAVPRAEGPAKIVIAGYKNRFWPERRVDCGGASFAMIAGSCGAVAARFSVGDVVLARSVLREGQPALPSDPNLLSHVKNALVAAAIPYKEAALLTVDGPVVRLEDRYRASALGGDVVDMESYGILKDLAATSVPAVVVRVVSDTADARARQDYGRHLDRTAETLSAVLKILCAQKMLA